MGISFFIIIENSLCLQDCHANCHLNCNCYKTYESCKTYNWSGWKTKTNICKNCGYQKIIQRRIKNENLFIEINQIIRKKK